MLNISSYIILYINFNFISLSSLFKVPNIKLGISICREIILISRLFLIKDYPLFFILIYFKEKENFVKFFVKPFLFFITKNYFQCL